MASSVSWVHWAESDLSHDSGQPWEEEVEEEFGGLMDENGLVLTTSRWDTSPSQRPAELEFLGDVRFPEEPASLPGHSAQRERRFDLGDSQDFELGASREDVDSAVSTPLDDGEDLELDRMLEDPKSPTFWHPRRDKQLDMTEDDEDQASMEEVERQGDDWEAGSEGEAYPELSFEVQYGSEYSISPDAPRDAQAPYEDCSKSISFTTDGGDEVSEHSDISPSPYGAPPEHLYRPAQRAIGDDFDSLSQLGESLEFPAETELSSASGRHPESPELSPLANATPWSLTGSLLRHVSMDDLQNAPSINAETCPESSYAERVEDPPRTAAKATSVDRIRASHHHPRSSAKGSRRPGDAFRVAGSPPPLRRVSSQPQDRARKLKKTISPALPSKFSRQSRSLSPRGEAAGKKEKRCNSPKATPSRPSPATAESLRYGRGQLNYPLPDFSKVEPRVKFPKDDQSYRPPRSRTQPMRVRGSGSPVIFKSPAEIVREVLLSSGEGSPEKCPIPSTARVPEEFKSPKQATELVQQLQEDYHRLLTKYAEAENTIDQLRLGAKVSLYSDPPNPSHSVHMGMVSHGSKIMAFSIPQIRTAEFSATSAPAQPAILGEGYSLAPGDQDASSLDHSILAGLPGTDGCTTAERPFLGDHLTQTLAGQTRKFQTQVEAFEELIQMRRLTPQDQLKGFTKLKDTQEALERAYLQAREEYRQRQQCRGTAEPLGDFDPDRAVEGEIFRLGMCLEELKDGIDRAVESQTSPQNCSEPPPPPRCLPTLGPEAQVSSPTPSVHGPVPALRTPYPESSATRDSHFQQVDTEVSSASGDVEEEREELPKPLQHKQLQVEEDFDNLLDQYNNFKSLPESLSMEQLGLEENRSSQEVDGRAAGDAGVNESAHRTLSLEKEANHRTNHGTPQPQPQEMKLCRLPAEEHQQLVGRSSCPPSVRGEESLPQTMPVKARPLAVILKPAFREQQEPLSRQSSMASVAGSAASDHLPRKPFHQAKASQSEDQRIVSPETDSGFVGSEASRVSPLTRTPEHHPSHTGMPGMLQKSASAPPPAVLRASLKKDTSPLSSEKGLRGMYTTPRQVPPRSSAPRHSLPHGSPSQTSSPPQWTDSITSEMAPDADSTHTDSEAEGQSGASTYNHHPSKTRHPPSSTTLSPSPVRAHHDLLDSRRERDQAIRALQKEVLRLRQRLEESLHRPQGYPTGKASPHTAKTKRKPLENGSSASSPATIRKPAERSPGECGEPAPVIQPARWARSASLPRDGPELDLTSESDYSPPRLLDGRSRAVFSSKKIPNAATFKGHYTGAKYHLSTPASLEPKEDTGSPSCIHCHSPRTQSGIASAGDILRSSQHSTPKKMHCPPCSGTKSTPTSKTRGKAGNADHGTESASSQHFGPSRKAKNWQQQLQPPGLWYLPTPPSATAVNYVPAVPLVHYAPPLVYCSPAASTSVPTPAGLPLHYPSGYRVPELKPWTDWQQAHRHHRSLTLDLDDLEDLNWSLNKAVEAAKSVKLTTKQMSRSLTSDLSKAKGLRGSCLF
ncbi:PREDICTED: AT-hook-containing transcription factor isoform X2 [Gavialis gangeticus]|uniref:AT-hook-containing transcription factor isoform X2 n=1 Tax=Gavialis gangeticus TaxID=94835 RepID=UPI00092E863D|nr:PREDICTED: AT-hook-containing transcription factor isoform X2 [Gavialis gangeticus]